GGSIVIMFLNKLSSPSSPYVPSVPSRWINRWTFLYEVIRDQSMNRVRRSPFRHMTWSAILRVRMAARLHKLSNSSLMAALAGFGVVSQRSRSVRRLVRVVATHAGERSATLYVASRHAQPVGGAGEFKPVFAFALVRYRARERAV